jgi:hypothetical protein
MRTNHNEANAAMKTLFRAFALALPLAFSAAPASAQTLNPEIRISANAGPSIQPVVAASGTNVYIAWVENVASGPCTDGTAGGYCGDIWFSRSTDNGVSFSAAINLTPGTTTRNDILPVIAAGGTQVHVYWTDSATTGTVFSRSSNTSGASFTAEVQLTTPDAFYSRPSGALVDSGGNVHFAYYDSSPSSGAAGQVFYRCSSNAGASYTTAVNITQFDGAVDMEAGRFAQGTDGTLYMMVRSAKHGYPFPGFPPFEQILYRSAAPSTSLGCGVTWLHPSQKVSPGLPLEWANTFGGNLAAGASNVLHAAYWSDKAGTNLFYRRGQPNGNGWGTPTDISGHGPNHLQWDGTVAEMSAFGIGEDAAGKVHVVFGENNHLREGFQAGFLYYRCSNDGGLTWVARTLASTSPETAQTRGTYNNNRFHMVWMDWRDNNTGAEIYYRNVTTGSCVAAANNVTVSAPALAFGGQSMGTTSPAQSVTLTNTAGVAATINGISVSSGFAQTNNCGASLAAGAQCTVSVTFTPPAAAGAINSTTPVSGALNVSSTQGNPSIALSGTGEKSLVTHYYRSILRRAPDSGGFSFWSSEATRMQGLGANVNETWYAMASFFYFSPEYLAFNRDDNGFVTDLYNTFFNRAPDSGGLAYWVGQIQSGMPREVVLVSFMISPEFNGFAQGIFGNTAAYPEVDMVGDFYRGILSRLPDTGGFNAWVGAFRNSQCQGANAGNSVYATVESLSSSFINGSEYAGRARTNAQFVGDLYNAFLRRGGDLPGVQFWINQLNGGTKTRDQMRKDFITTSEFTNRVSAVISVGCH